MSKKCQPCEPVVLYCEPPVVKVHHRVELVNARQCVQCSQLDNGVDPVLGPPYPPVNYQAFVNSGQPRVTRTVPQIITSASVSTVGSDSFIAVKLNNYSYPLWSNVVTYDLGATVRDAAFPPVRYSSLIASNLNNTPASTPADWLVDTTLFKCYVRSVKTSDGTIVDWRVEGDSLDHTYGLIYVFGLSGPSFTFQFIGGGAGFTWQFYITASIGGRVATSNVVAITL